MGFAIGRPTADRRAHTGRVLGVDPVHVERNMIARSSSPRGTQSLFHDGAHASLVDVAHGVDLADAGAANVGSLCRVDIAHTDEDGIFRCDLWRESADV